VAKTKVRHTSEFVKPQCGDCGKKHSVQRVCYQTHPGLCCDCLDEKNGGPQYRMEART
jgi:hypothetical protein